MSTMGRVEELIEVMAINPGRPSEHLNLTCKHTVALTQRMEREAVPVLCHVVVCV